MMKEIALHNTAAKADIVDYPIAEAILDDEGNARIDPDTQHPMTTGDTHEWSLLAGETKIFPKYVADYLKSIYDFLEEVKAPQVDEEATKEKRQEPRKEGDPFRCKTCGKESKNIRGLGLHIAAKHPELLT